MIKLLSIGNSFSQDATAYLYDMARCGNIDIKVVNLYIGGCSLYTHWENVKNDTQNYQYEINGRITDRMVSIKEALLEDDWDFFTMQQASQDSGLEETYFPYIEQLSDCIKKYSAGAKQLIHQTWAYEIDSTHDGFIRYDNNQMTMYKTLSSAYKKVAQTLGLELIPCGDVIQTLRGLEELNYAKGGQSLCRDGFHMHLIYGRYAVAATWYQSVLKGNIIENHYVPPNSDHNTNDKLIRLIKQTVNQVCG